MRKFNKLFVLMTIVSSVLFLSACGGNNKPGPEPEPEKTLTVTPETLEIPGIGGTKTLEVKSQEQWVAESNETWCVIDKKLGKGDDVITVTITGENPKSDASRPATITIKTTKETVTVTVTQLAGPARPLNDRGRLMQLFDATGGKNWTNNDNWGTDAHVSEWYGVVVDENDPDLILGLNLEANNLIGMLPDEICNITSFVFLNMQQNKLNGEIPSNIGNLTNLLTLSLFENELTGSIPKSIGNLTSMTYFSVWLNKMSGPIPTEIGNCTMLEALWLYGNKFDGQIPTSIGKLQNLVNLYIRENDFSGTIPTELGNCTKLVNCEIGVNPKLGGSIPTSLGNLRNLEYLYLRSCNLTGKIPAELFFSGSKLNKLNIRDNHLSGSIPGTIDLAPLQEAYLKENELIGNVPAGLLSKAADKVKFQLTPQRTGFGFDNLANN